MSIERFSIPQVVAKKVISQINSGALSQFLPGQLKLSKEYKVSVPSVIEALVILERDGYIEPAEKGKKRKIIAKRVDFSTRLNLLVISPPTHNLTTGNIDLLEKAKLAWKQKFNSSECIHLQRIHRPMNLEELEHEILVNNIRAILVFEATQGWVKVLTEVNLPIHRFGGTSFSPKYGNSGFGHHIENILTEGIEKLISMGHTKILTPLTRPYLHETTTTVYQHQLKPYGIDPISYCPEFPINDPACIQAFWHQKLTRLQPTAVLSIHLPVLYSLIGFCNSAKLSIPDNISVVSLMNHELLDYFEPKIIAPQIKNYERIALFQKWLDSKFQEQGFTHLPLDLSDGGSIKKMN